MDQKNFEKIYAEYYKKILAFVNRKVSNIYDAEELTGDVFLNFYRTMDRFDVEKSSAATWLYIIAANRLKNYYRDKKDHLSIENLESGEGFEIKSTEEWQMVVYCRMEIMNGLRRLPRRDRTILVYKYYLGKTSKEIAENMGLTDGNVRVIQRRSLNKLRKIMEKQGR